MQAAIETDGLSRRFGTKLAVDAIDLRVPSGSVTGFLGPNGAGKTTTIRMLLGLLRPTAGSIRVFGRAMPDDRLAIARSLGALVETPCHYDHLTGRENLEITRRLCRLPAREIDRVLALVGLGSAERQRVGGYSLGMRQRLGIARALLGAPQLLILDEPTNGLGPDGIIEMRRLLRMLADEHGTTVLVSSHLLREVELIVDQVALIWKGRLVAQSPLSELLARIAPCTLIDVETPETAAKLLERHGVAAERRANGTIEVRAAERAAADLNRLLVNNGIGVTALRQEQPSLESAYLALTAEAA